MFGPVGRQDLIGLRKHLRAGAFWEGGAAPQQEVLREQIGVGTYGTVFRATRLTGDVAVKTITIESEAALQNAVREYLIQDIVYSAYDASASKECWAPVHHPFPTLYSVSGHKVDRLYSVRASMFLFQRGERTLRARFQTTLQLAAVLHHLHTRSPIRFMHRDLHWNNVLRRNRSKPVRLPLYSRDRTWTSLEQGDCSKRVFDCGPEAAVIDFGLGWVQLPSGDVLQAETNVYPHKCRFNSQHDLRLFFVSAYSIFCVNGATLMPKHGLDAFATMVADLIDEARCASPRFALRTSLWAIRGIASKIASHRFTSATFSTWLDTFPIQTPLLDVDASTWTSTYVPFLLEYKHVWKTVWDTGKMPNLTHFQYNSAILIDDTPCFDPPAVLSRTAQQWV